MTFDPFSQDTWNAVDRYVSETFIGDDPAQQHTLKTSNDGGLPKIAVSASQGRLLMILAQMIGVRSILEIGTLGGFSTIWLARALPADGKLISLEFEKKHADVARANIRNAGLEKKVEVVVGPASESLSRFISAKQAPFDFVFIDADKTGYPGYLEQALKLTKPGSVIIADNVVRDGEVIDPNSKDVNVLAVRRFNEQLAREPRLTAVILPTIGSKGLDGFAIARVNS